MAESTWTNQEGLLDDAPPNRMKFVIGGLVIAAVVVFLIVNGMSGNSQLYKTVDEFYAQQDRLVGRDLRVAGWVLGDTIQYTQIDAENSRLEFDIVDDIDNPGQRMHIVAINEPKPDLLQHEAQALVIGRADANGVMTSNEDGLLLKCPTRYEELEPEAGA